MPHADRPPWGWIDPARGMLIVVAAALGVALIGISRGGPTARMSPPTLVVDANSVPPEVLGALPGIGPVLAGRIVEAREAAPFRDLGDLDRRVKGIGPARASALRPHLRFDPAVPSTESRP